MMRSDVLNLAAQRNMFLSPEALEIVLSDPEPRMFINNILSAISKNTMFIGKDDVLGFLSGNTEKELRTVAPKNKRQPDISIIPGTDVTGESMCEGKVDDFSKYFMNRYNALRDILKRKTGAPVPIERVRSMDREVHIIGMVSETSVTKNGHRMLRLEDDSGSCKAIILKDSPHINDIIVNDEVIGLTGSPTRDGMMLVASEIIRPGVPSERWEPSDSVASVAFLSDIHVGSHTFLETRWKSMAKWLRENAKSMDLDYLILPGDVVDGIGIFPGQQEELSIDDIYKQYNRLAEYLKEIPDHIKIVLQPGNHDAVRPAEPQPALSEIFTKMFDSNVMMTANPVQLNIEGRTILTYHGRSIDDWVASVQRLTYEDPVAVMKEMLDRRHLAPMYGLKTALAPEKKDYLVIDKRPDIFVTGHVHGAATEEYRGIRLIAASTWQDQTEFQKMHNFNPQPGVMPIVHLGTGKTTMKGF
ncbi:MAG: DNA-directed DNA polymerase II small subunit [Methanomassiliicoccaceae archaeon]|jgi:DNA polymerase II small subunit|nr:DNA-directed DNA polymerase II small subunit [Methanomassiliicoccaceae archaeon]